MFVGSKPIHLHQKLVQGRFAFVVAAKVAAFATRFAYCVDFIDENDARSVLLGRCKKIPHTRRTHTNEHLHEFGSRNRKEWNRSFTGGCLCEESFTSSRRARENSTTGDLR